MAIKNKKIVFNNNGSPSLTDNNLKIVPPNSLEAEKALISSILIDNSQANSVLGSIMPEDFYDTVNARIFKVLVSLGEKGEPIDIITILNAIQKERDYSQYFSDFDLSAYLTTLYEMPAGLFNVEQYAKIVKEKSILRNLINASNKVRQKCYEQRDDVDDIIDFSEKTIFDATEKDSSKNYVEVYPLIVNYFTKLSSKKNDDSDITGVHSGFQYLDELTNGFQPSDLIIIAGRPSMGKTALSLSIAKNIAVKKIPVAFFSLEMSKEQLATRLLSLTAKIDSSMLRRGRIHNPDIENIHKALEMLEDIPIYIDDSAGITVTELRAKTRRLKREKGIGIAIIDYLQLMKASPNIESREQAIADISRSLKSLAKELNIPVIALSQLNRMVESRQDRKPQLADLRESGAIEQDADLIMFVYREEVYKKDTENKGIAELIIGKQRNGPTGIVKLSYTDKYTSFENLAYEEDSYI
ncbi:MAG: replicative DNA helicase [Candidatus Acidulodesulfobacterium ferriphilum]|jgi:replicative DNA helicase|uniref:Replicative DNA helicase n=1 Tax=Candidatus Acidulodesulfobacterium ferriphilum TaxID=2597223 RepID=A0A519BCB2_9DELT|nr:MAG: replicative DNA helicase [Candidatus Acidulodesulfobacterium ferriphilum]